MRKIAVFISACVLAAAFSGCAGRQNEKAEYIGIEAARQSALTEAGVDEADAEFTVSGLDNRDGVFYYQIDFVSGSNEYKYAVDALTGVIIGASISIQDSTQDSAADTVQDNEQNAVQDTANNATQDGAQDILHNAAQDNAYNATQDSAHDAQYGSGNGVDENADAGSAAGLNSELGQSAFSGSEETAPPESTQAYGAGHHGGEGYGGGSHNGGHGQMNGMGAGGYFSEDLISVDEVNDIVLKRVPGASADDIKLEMDHDDGRILYEGELIHDGIEFEFKIDAYSGSVIEWEAEFKD
jgi:uncharacterized membrane protein YkoI